MATQDSMRENGFVANHDEGAGAFDDVPAAGRTGRGREDLHGSQAADPDAEEDMEFQEILLPASLRDSLSELAEAVRNVVRTQPLAILAAAAAAAYLAGRRASRR